MSVILEKARGQIDVSKLRVILLLELDFNTLNKLIFNMKLMPSLESRNFIPYEIIRGRRGYLAVYVALNKKLASDIANQTKKLTVVISADVTNCYD